MHSSHPTSSTYTTQNILYFSVLYPPHQQDVHQRRTKRRRNEDKKQTNILSYVSYICTNMNIYIYERNITHNNKTCTHLILLLLLILHNMYYISASFTPLINKTYNIEERRHEGMKIRSRQTYSQKYHTYVQTCIETYMNVTSPTTRRHALISSYFQYLYYTKYTIFQCPLPPSSTRRTSKKNEETKE